MLKKYVKNSYNLITTELMKRFIIIALICAINGVIYGQSLTPNEYTDTSSMRTYRYEHYNGIFYTFYNSVQYGKISAMLDTDTLYYLLDRDAAVGVYTLGSDTANFPEILNTYYSTSNTWGNSPSALYENYVLDAYWAAEQYLLYIQNKLSCSKGFLQRNPINNYRIDDTITPILITDMASFDNTYWHEYDVHSRFSRELAPPHPKYRFAIVIGSPGILYAPKASIDDVVHECAHIFSFQTWHTYNTNTADDKLAEACADIWAAIITHEIYPNDEERIWKIGEDVVLSNSGHSCIRNLAMPNDPTAEIQMDTCICQASEGNTSQQSGIISHWFYLLTHGFSGKGCDGKCYSFPAIPIDTAAKLIYNCEMSHFYRDMDFPDIVRATYDAADVFSNPSEIRLSICGAWNVVGASTCGIDEYNDMGIEQYGLSFDHVNTEEYYVSHDIFIDSLKTLSLTGTIHMNDSARIIVRPGGKLIVNGGTLTSACEGEMWQGIIVEGHNNIRQAALAQGSVILNNATIENAWTAISTRGADTNAVYEHTGGIVQATNTLFRNNRRSVEFLSYENHTTTHQVTDNASYFTRCTFTVDDDNLFVAQGRNFQNHVTMWQVRGVKFNGCSFHNEMTGTSHRGKAVSTIEAGFNVKRVCPSTVSPLFDSCYCEGTSTDTVTRCTFVGFDTAVHTSSTLGNYDITLDNCDFRQDFSGVHLAAADNARVSFCDFNIDHTLRAATGLRSLNTTGYTIEGNNFHRTSYSTRIALGAEIIESGTADNTIRLNGFENLYYACYVSGINGTDGNYRNSGLQFLCNTFSGNKYDIYAYSNGRIRRTQGQLSAGADNDFVNTRANSLTIPSTHDPVTYYRSSGGNHQPIGSSSYYTVLNATTNSCASTICGIHIDNPIVHGLNGGALPQYQSMAEHLGHLQEQYENIQYLESEEAVALQSEMSDLSAAMSELARTEIRGIISDSVPDLALLKDWYKAINTPLTHYLMAETQSTEGLWDKARATLEDIPVRFELDDSEKDEYTQYGSLQSLREAVSGNWYKLSDNQIAQMQRVAEFNGGRAARMAKEILCFFHHICYEEAPFLDEMDQPEFGTRGLAVGKADPDNALTLSPNPANSTVTLQLSDPQDEIRQITVANMQGQVMLSQTVNATTPYTLDISALPAGIYAVRVLTANGTVATAKGVKE